MRVSCLRLLTDPFIVSTKMSFTSGLLRMSNCLQGNNLSNVNSLAGFSTYFGTSVRSYIRNFWAKPTAFPVPGHMHKSKSLDGHNKLIGNKGLKLWGTSGANNWRPSEIRRTRKRSYEAKMQYKTGREFIMQNMLRGKKKFAEF